MDPASLLIVDDQHTHPAAVRNVLEQDGFHVVWTTCREDALRALHRENFHLALLEMLLSDASGLSLACQLHRSFPELKLVLWGAYPVAESQLRRCGCGASGFVDKNVATADLSAFLRKKVSRLY